jgi:hypothetical protein
MGRRIDPAFLLGTSLLPAATRQGESAPGGGARLGLQMDPHPLPLLARSPPIRGVYLSPGTPSSWFFADPKSGKGILKNRKKTLTAPLRACVRLGGSVGPPGRSPPTNAPAMMCSLVPLPRPCARAPPHTYLITWSAWNRSAGGMVRPSALAALRLMTSSNFAGCSTGRSAGFAPLRILSTNVAARRARSSGSSA